MLAIDTTLSRHVVPIIGSETMTQIFYSLGFLKLSANTGALQIIVWINFKGLMCYHCCKKSSKLANWIQFWGVCVTDQNSGAIFLDSTAYSRKKQSVTVPVSVNESTYLCLCVTLTCSRMMKDQWQCIKTNLICTYSWVRWGRELLLGTTNCCLGICVRVYLCVYTVCPRLRLCQYKQFSEYLMHVFVCVCLSVCDNRMSAKTEELMRPFFAMRSGLDKVHKALWALFLCIIMTAVGNLCDHGVE